MTPDKKDIANHLLNKGSLFIHLDPRVTGVVVPVWLTHQAQLALQVGWNMPIPIHDLTVTEYGISGTLSFQRTPFFCGIPWSSVFALVGDEDKGVVWDESMPEEVKAEVAKAAAGKLGTAEKIPSLQPSPRPKLTLIQGGKTDKGSAPDDSPKAS